MEMWQRVFEHISVGVAVCGWICTILTRTLSVWIVTGAVENTTDTLSLYWDGIWLNWQEPRVGDLHCHFYQTLLSLAGRFNSWKVSLSVLIGVGVIPIVLYIVALTAFPHKVRIKAVAGFLFVLSGLLMLVIMSWITHATNSDLDTTITLKREWGASLYSGWIGMVLFLIGGGVLSTWWCKSSPQPQEQIQTAQSPAMPEVDDPLFARHHAAFIPSPYRQTISPI
ncbi:Claudin-17 [Bagarius yarrelli]|uniref:Claudin-17 n=1 Tax=Bagarius yarrelli TaxID=175774 RepID=A0A556UYK4_BAGYA|nr:Claudin-17 [Bagarius yarrelli]